MRGLPEQGQQVFVVAPSGAGIPARVLHVEAKSSLISFEDNESDPVNMLAGGNVAIQYTNNRGVCRIDGSAHKAKGISVLRVDYTSKIQLIQRREYVRIDAIVPCTYRPIGMTGWLAETTTINVSGGGFMISGREGLNILQEMEFTLALDGDTKEAGPLDCVGKVVRETRAGLGILIQEIDQGERERLIRWVFSRERVGRQIVRGV